MIYRLGGKRKNHQECILCETYVSECSQQHREFICEGYTLLVYYECIDCMKSAIMREKQIKGGSRKSKLKLIESMNPDWVDLYPSIIV